ncbi:MAG: hypothetical protein WC976_06875 [Caldisericia bacterium]
MKIDLLHIYGQSSHHDDAFIVGNRGALEKLKKAIEKALSGDEGTDNIVSVSVNDGEGYDLHITMDNSDWGKGRWSKRAVPYTADYAVEKKEGAIYPWLPQGDKK